MSGLPAHGYLGATFRFDGLYVAREKILPKWCPAAMINSISHVYRFNDCRYMYLIVSVMPSPLLKCWLATGGGEGGRMLGRHAQRLLLDPFSS